MEWRTDADKSQRPGVVETSHADKREATPRPPPSIPSESSRQSSCPNPGVGHTYNCSTGLSAGRTPACLSASCLVALTLCTSCLSATCLVALTLCTSCLSACPDPLYRLSQCYLSCCPDPLYLLSQRCLLSCPDPLYRLSQCYLSCCPDPLYLLSQRCLVVLS